MTDRQKHPIRQLASMCFGVLLTGTAFVSTSTLALQHNVHPLLLLGFGVACFAMGKYLTMEALQ